MDLFQAFPDIMGGSAKKKHESSKFMLFHGQDVCIKIITVNSSSQNPQASLRL